MENSGAEWITYQQLADEADQLAWEYFACSGRVAFDKWEQELRDGCGCRAHSFDRFPDLELNFSLLRHNKKEFKWWGEV